MKKKRRRTGARAAAAGAFRGSLRASDTHVASWVGAEGRKRAGPGHAGGRGSWKRVDSVFLFKENSERGRSDASFFIFLNRPLTLARSLSPKISSILHQESFHLRGPRRKRESTALTQELKKTLLALCYTVKRRKRILKINNKKPDFCPSCSLLLSPPPPRPPGQRRQLGQRPGRRR